MDPEDTGDAGVADIEGVGATSDAEREVEKSLGTGAMMAVLAR